MSKLMTTLFTVAIGLLPSGILAQTLNYSYGMNTHYVDPNMGDKMRELRGGLVRIDFPWRDMELSPGEFNWAPYDASVLQARSRGLTVLAGLGDTPPWANGGQPHNVPP